MWPLLHMQMSTLLQLVYCSVLLQLGAAGPLNVGIVGAGPAGLSLAIALRKLLGHDQVDVQVFDKSNQLRPRLGGGVNLNSGAAVLGRLGLRSQLLASGNPARRLLSRNVDGDVLLDIDIHGTLAADERSKQTGLVGEDGKVLAVTIMRDKLQEILFEALPPEAIHLDKKLVDVRLNSGDRCRCTFEGGQQADFDLVVGADGIRSTVRDFLSLDQNNYFGGDEAGYTGIKIQWGVAPAGSRPSGADTELHQWFGRGAYCLSSTYGGRDGQMYDQCVVVYGSDNAAGLPAINANWETAEAQKAMVSRLQQASMPDEVLQLAAACDRHFELGSYFRNPLISWQGLDGRVVLLGDAAHAMPPFLGQGTNQGVQDAYCLAQVLQAWQQGRHGSLAEALGAYEFARKFPTARLTLNSRVLGFVETGLPPLARDAFFRTTDVLGIVNFIFKDGAIPKV